MSEFGVLKKQYNSKSHGKTEYIIGLADGLKGSEMAVQLNGLIAPSLAMAIPEGIFEGGNEEINISDLIGNAEGLAKGVELLATKLLSPDNKQLRMDLLDLCQFQTKKMQHPAKVTNHMETHFQKNYGAYSFLLKEVITHNDFLDLTLSFLQNLGENEKEESSKEK
jgi:hypothetical protein